MESHLVLDDVEKFALMKLRRQISDVAKSQHDDFFLVRWLRARNWNVEAAEEMLRESFRWRSFWDVDDGLKRWKPPEALELYYPSGSTGFDIDGTPVIFVPFSGLDIRGVLHSASKQDVVRFTVKILEEHLEMSTKTHKVMVVFDMENFALKDYAWRPAAEVVVALLKMYEANYPEVLKVCYIINAPAVFAVAFSVVKRFLNEQTLGKIFIYKNDPAKWEKVLRAQIPLHILPKYYGGELVDSNDDPKCSLMIRQGGKIPKSLYKNKLENLRGEDEENSFESVLVKKGKKFMLDFIVAEEGCLLKWNFRTEDHDIKFGITYCDRDGKTSPAVRFQRVASNQVNETGMLACRAPATYTVVFDNTYSMIRNKKLHYQIFITESIHTLSPSILPEKLLQKEELDFQEENKND